MRCTLVLIIALSVPGCSHDDSLGADLATDAAVDDLGAADLASDAAGDDLGASDQGQPTCVGAGGACVAVAPDNCPQGILNVGFSCGPGIGAICCLPSLVTPDGGSELVPPNGAIYLGAWVNTGGPGNETPAMLATFEQQVGRKMALSMHYHGWTTPFPTSDEVDDESNGRVPVISWSCGIPNVQVAAGAADANISAQADSVKAFGKPVFIRYMWEMNLPGGLNPGRKVCHDPTTDLPNGYFSPTQYVAAWQHIRSVFSSRGATNVIWLWNPSGVIAGSGSTKDPMPYYPGDAQVDWVGVDHYDHGHLPISQLYAAPYAMLSTLNKPILIGETGALAADQSAFFQNGAAGLKTYPLIKAFMYWDSVGNFDWSLTSSGVAAFAAMASDPYLSAMAPP